MQQVAAALSVDDVSVSYNGMAVLEKISFAAAPGQLTGIIGPNGAGKSTLLKAIMGLVNVDCGSVRILGLAVDKVRPKIAYLPQKNTFDTDFPISVEGVVMTGRYPHLGWCALPGEKDRRIVEECLHKVSMLQLRKRQIGQLSGGEQQRVLLARALAQEAELFFLDEPFAGIDLVSESVIMGILKELRSEGKTIFAVHHDLSKTEGYFDTLILMNKRIIAFGKTKEVFRARYLQETYQGSIAVINGYNELMVVNA